jgi:hypothetical protein
MRIYVRVPQTYSAQVHRGHARDLTLPEYPGRKFDATLTRSAGAVDPQSGTVLVELQAPNGDRALKPGAYAQVKLPAQRRLDQRHPAAERADHRRGRHPGRGAGPDGKAQCSSTVTIGRDMGARSRSAPASAATDRVIDNPPDSLQTGDQVRQATEAVRGKCARLP